MTATASARAGWKRLFLAVALIPFTAAAIAFLAACVAAAGDDSFDTFDMAGSVAAGVFLVSALAAVIVVLPVAVSWRARGLLTRNRILVTGLVLGNVPLAIAIIGAGLGGQFGWFGPFGTLVFGSLVGGGSALVFWIVGVRVANRSHSIALGVSQNGPIG